MPTAQSAAKHSARHCHDHRFKAVPLKSFFKLLIGNLKDPTLILLMAAAMVMLSIIGLRVGGLISRSCVDLHVDFFEAFIHLFCLPYLQISTVLGVAVKDQREESAWSEGVAIWVAVFVVSGVGAAPIYLSAPPVCP